MSPIPARRAVIASAGIVALCTSAPAQVRVDHSTNVTPDGQRGESETAYTLTQMIPLNTLGAGSNHAAAHGVADLGLCRFTVLAHGCNTLAGGLYAGGDASTATASFRQPEPYRLEMPSVPDGTFIPVTFRTTVQVHPSAVSVLPGPSSAAAVLLTASRTLTRPGYGFTFAESGTVALDNRGNASATGTLLPGSSDHAAMLNLAVGDGYYLDMYLRAEASMYEYCCSSNANIEGVMTWGMDLPPGARFVSTRTGLPVCGSDNTDSSYVDELVPPSLALDPCDLFIARQPSSVEACPLGTARMFVFVLGTPPVTYQWRVRQGRGAWTDVTNGPITLDGALVGNVTGATEAGLRIDLAPTASGPYDFRCLVRNGCGSTASQIATLRTTATPATIFQQPVPAAVCASGTAGFTVAADGTKPLEYQWQWRTVGSAAWQDMIEGDNADPSNPACTPLFSAAGANAASVSLRRATGAGCPLDNSPTRREVRVVVSNTCGPFTSNSAAWTICSADFNCSGTLSVQDIFDFLAGYFSNDPRADFNQSGVVSVQDIFDFLGAYFAGC